MACNKEIQRKKQENMSMWTKDKVDYSCCLFMPSVSSERIVFAFLEGIPVCITCPVFVDGLSFIQWWSMSSQKQRGEEDATNKQTKKKYFSEKIQKYK